MRRRNHLGGYCLGAVALMLSLGLGCASSKSPQQGRSEYLHLASQPHQFARAEFDGLDRQCAPDPALRIRFARRAHVAEAAA